MRLSKLALPLCALVLLPGCAPTIVATAAPSCRALQTVLIDNEDWLTEQTAQQIEANNLARERLCGKKKRKTT
jgi:hypothetical protein